ncbi:glutamine synthetase [Streptomyces sp. V3I8]|uniref:glutamine synthetase family protein n=1 Tax=Streptomyces sp. V3I8 TaxID=3042279 RepID=UPI002787D9FA|nr:glutamine synthetase family protein [Streptomyces sp. V3I8]MDQ1038568.1 glutamine synthetase [Streptomyces sp. V3I8]
MTHETQPNDLPVLASGLQQPENLVRLVEEGEITTVMLAVPDMQGRLKGKLHDARTFLDRFESEMCSYVLATDLNMNAQPGYSLTGWDDGFQDLHVVPDPKSIRRLSYLPGTVLVHGDAVRHGWPIDVAPRQMLRQQIAELASLGYRAKVGIESEFMLYKGTPAQARRRGYRGLVPVSPYNLDYALDHPPALSAFFHDLWEVLHTAGCPPEAIKTEGAPGQIEVTWPYGAPMAACDVYTVHQHAVRHLAAQHKMAPTFMAAPQTGVGSGLHLHVSLWRDEDDSAFWMEQGSELPEPLQHSVAGLLDALPHLAPLYAPTSNSYKRYRPHSFAPTRFTWGHGNRTCAIRITGEESNPHLENRVPGADANPYLALAATLAGIIHGLRNQPKLPPPCTGDSYQDTHAREMPYSLDEATTDFASSRIASLAFGPDPVDHYVHAAELEHAALAFEVTDVELARGFDRG